MKLVSVAASIDFVRCIFVSVKMKIRRQVSNNRTKRQDDLQSCPSGPCLGKQVAMQSVVTL